VRWSGGTLEWFAPSPRFDKGLVHLQTHSIMDLVIGQSNMVFIHGVPVQMFEVSCSKHDGCQTRVGLHVPFLQDDPRRFYTGLRSDEFLEVADRIVRTAFHSDWKAI